MTSHHIHLPHRLAGLLCLLAAAWAGPALAQSRALQAMDFVALDGDRVLFTFTLSEAAPEPVVFTIDRPARLSMDLPDTRLALTERYKRVNVGKARAIAAAESKDRTRVVVELAELTAHSVQVEGNKVFLTLEGTGTAAPIPLTIVPSSAAASPAVPVAAAIRNVDFRRGDSGEGRVVVTLTDPRSAVDVREEGGKVIAEFKDTTVAENLLRRLDVLDFATPVKFIDTLRDGVDTRIVVTPAAGSEFEQVAYQAGELFTLELQPISAEQRAERRRTDPQYTGERISLSFQNVDVRSLLQIIADVAGVNMVVSDSVRGDIAMRLQNVPWDQALDIILRTKGLGMRQQGNVMLVAPLSEFAERDRALAEADKQNQVSAPLRSEIIQINYARAAEISALLRSGENSFLSERGRVSVDDRTNTLLVLETRDKLTEIRNLIARLDIPVRQVLIESRIVVATSDYTKELGARFGVQHINTLNDATVGSPGTELEFAL